MAKVGVKIKVLPESTEVDLTKLKVACTKEIEKFKGIVRRVEEKPIAFGLVSLEFTFVYDEADGQLDPLEEKLTSMDKVRSAEVIDVRRMLG